jgi:hypothetical protein
MIKLTTDRADALALIDDLLNAGAFKAKDCLAFIDRRTTLQQTFEEGSTIDISNAITPNTNVTTPVANEALTPANDVENPGPLPSKEQYESRMEPPAGNDLGLDEPAIEDLPF